MHSRGWIPAAALALAAGLLPAVSAGADTTRQTGPTAEEYVVSYEAGDYAAAAAAVEAAGGTVVSVTDAVGVALVATENPTFAAEAGASDALAGVSLNHSVGTTVPGMPHRFVEERPALTEGAITAQPASRSAPAGRGGRNDPEPLASMQWDMAMIGATPDGAWRRATGRGVIVASIDTGVEASHPDIAPNFSHELSRNFTMDIPEVDGACEFATCIDRADVDHNGHGTHTAGTMASPINDLGVAGVAPEATIMNARAGQDSGFFFLYETVAALVWAADAGADVANMSFFTDPWLWNCDDRGDYISGTVSDEELAQQQMTRQLVTAALEYAHDAGVTLVASAGNSHFNLEAPLRPDDTSPNFPLGTAHPRVVTNDCLDLPAEGPHVLTVSALGPTTTKADYSNYGEGIVEISAPGGWFRDGFGTPIFRTPGTQVFASYSHEAAIAEGIADEDLNPLDDFGVRDCNDRTGVCGFYYGIQGTSMAGPHVAGVAALVIQKHGTGSPRRGFDMDPDAVAAILLNTATDHTCPAGGVEDYSDEGRPPDWNAVCEGTLDNNGIYGKGIVNATAAVARQT